ncbi:MAG: DNA cytosine methyltransferase [Oscillospiraceae bacterium]
MSPKPIGAPDGLSCYYPGGRGVCPYSHPIKLADGFYIIRKLTVTECERLQTLPDGYTSNAGVSNTQCYKGLGNGWTAEVIIHILRHGLRRVPRDTPILALSMYDGIGTGRYCLDKLGFTNNTYKAYEIDKYAMQIASHNYPDIIQCGDAFKLRADGWDGTIKTKGKQSIPFEQLRIEGA